MNAVAVMRDGRYVISGSDDRQLIVTPPAVSGTFLTSHIFVQAQANQRGSLGLGWTTDHVQTADWASPGRKPEKSLAGAGIARRARGEYDF